jgi:SagB-type dehydrogenase family enzyme
LDPARDWYNVAPVAHPCSLASLVPHSRYFAAEAVSLDLDEPLLISRFAYIRHETDLVLHSPLGLAHLILESADALVVYHRLCKGASAAELIATLAGRASEADVLELLRMMIVCRIVERVPPAGAAEDARARALRMWEFHDLLMQAESRFGRSLRGIGGDHRFLNQIEAPPAVKPISWPGARIPLHVPPPDAPFARVTLEQALATRKSASAQGVEPISLIEVGEFLYRTARILSLSDVPWPREFPHGGAYTRRAYPCGGARYEQELYLSVDRCSGLDRGFYYYDALDHQLVEVTKPTRQLEQLLQFSTMASGGTRAQILVTIASRFQRTSWKYRGLAFALQLKNAGVLLAHMYLVAAGMGLASRALGVSDSDLFSRLAGLEYVEESSIAEFQLGSRFVDPAG